MTSNVTTELCYYFKVLSRCSDSLFCPHCNESLLPKHYENHVSKQHGINGKTICVWCQQVSWPSGEKYKHKNHLLSCFKKFIEARPSTSVTLDPLEDNPQEASDDAYVMEPDPLENIDISPYRLLSMTHPFPEKHFFGHQMPQPDPMFYNTLEEFLNIPVPPLPSLPPIPVSFEDENLNLAASCVLFYLTDTLDFFHVMIKLVVIESFLEAMNEDRGNSYMLPFSCWCNGGTFEESEYRQHRHAIIASRKDHFQRNVWPKIQFPADRRPPKPNFLCKKLKTIVSPRHLVNTIGYVSQRQSRCNFSFEKGKPMKNNHFYLYRTLPVDFKLHLALLWNNGVRELLYETKFQNVSIPRLATGILTHDGRRWTQKIKDFYGHERGLVLRVARDYVPTREVTPHFLHLAQRQKLYFTKSLENRNLEPRVWLQKQIEGGNLFYDAVEECTWIPRPRDQRMLNFHKPVVDRCRELESRVAELEESNRELARENQSLRSRLEEMYLKVQQLTEQVIRYKDEEIERLKRENAKLKRIIERQKRIIERQRRQIQRLV